VDRLGFKAAAIATVALPKKVAGPRLSAFVRIPEENFFGIWPAEHAEHAKHADGKQPLPRKCAKTRKKSGRRTA
jgi:hypothetical protein